MNRYILIAILTFFQTIGHSQRLLIDSTNNDDGYLYLSNARILRSSVRPPADSIIRLYSEYEDAETDSFQLRFAGNKLLTSPGNSGFELDSAYCRNLFRALVYSLLEKKGGEIKLSPIKNNDITEEEEGEDNVPEKKYKADLNIHLPFTVSNSIASFVIPSVQFRVDTLNTDSIQEWLHLQVGKVIFHEAVK